MAVYLWCVSACGATPTAPSLIPADPIVAAPSIPTSPVSVDDGLTRDPRFDLAFYRRFVLEDGTRPLNRLTHAPAVFLATVDDHGNAIDPRALDRVAAALINTTAAFAGETFGVASIARGSTPTPADLTVRWSSETTVACGATTGRTITLYYRATACQCQGLIRPRTVAHELGHAMGYSHTADSRDLMSGLPDSRCEQALSDRERFHAQVAYRRPVGSLDP